MTQSASMFVLRKKPFHQTPYVSAKLAADFLRSATAGPNRGAGAPSRPTAMTPGSGPDVREPESSHSGTIPDVSRGPDMAWQDEPAAFALRGSCVLARLPCLGHDGCRTRPLVWPTKLDMTGFTNAGRLSDLWRRLREHEKDQVRRLCERWTWSFQTNDS